MIWFSFAFVLLAHFAFLKNCHPIPPPTPLEVGQCWWRFRRPRPRWAASTSSGCCNMMTHRMWACGRRTSFSTFGKQPQIDSTHFGYPSSTIDRSCLPQCCLLLPNEIYFLWALILMNQHSSLFIDLFLLWVFYWSLNLSVLLFADRGCVFNVIFIVLFQPQLLAPLEFFRGYDSTTLLVVFLGALGGTSNYYSCTLMRRL